MTSGAGEAVLGGLATGAGCAIVALLGLLSVVAGAVLLIRRMKAEKVAEMADKVKAAAAGRKPEGGASEPATAPPDPGRHAGVLRMERRLAIVLAVKNLPDPIREFLDQDVRVAISSWDAAERDLAAVPGMVTGSVASYRRQVLDGLTKAQAGGFESSGLEVPSTPERAAAAGWFAGLQEGVSIVEAAEAEDEAAEALWGLVRACATALSAFEPDAPDWQDHPELHDLMEAFKRVIDGVPAPPAAAGTRPEFSGRYEEALRRRADAVGKLLEVTLQYVRMTAPGNARLRKSRTDLINQLEKAIENDRRFNAAVAPFRPKGGGGAA